MAPMYPCGRCGILGYHDGGIFCFECRLSLALIQPEAPKCPVCGKKKFGFSIPRMGLYEVGLCECGRSQSDRNAE